jgi:molybdopterin-containing oxidoreductase family iron-sulfur binding subunit
MNNQENITKVWVGVEDLTQDPEFLKSQELEFPEFSEDEGNNDGQGPSRRDFLKYVGFGIGAATLASCEIPVKKAIPYLVKPEEIVPGVATYYATTFVKGGDCVPVLVKTREGRPIKIEGHPMSFTKGGTSARSQASVLDLYDTNRVKTPGKVKSTAGKGKKAKNAYSVTEMSWADMDKEIMAKLNEGSQIRIVSHTTMSPTLAAAIAQFKNKFPNTKHVQYEPFSTSALLEANQAMFGKGFVPNYRFDQAKCVVGIECDFLGTWVSPVEYAADYIKNRKLNDEQFVNATKEMSVHIQFEGHMSLTGSNADHRVLLKPSEQAVAVKMLFNEVASMTGNGGGSGSAKFSWTKANAAIKNAAKKLVENKGKALVVCGINDVNIQKVVNGINEMLGAYGSTILWTGYSKQRNDSDKAIQELTAELGSIDALFVMGANPAFDLPGLAANFAKGLGAMSKAGKVTASFNGSIDETSALCTYVTPDHNYLESWGDVNPKEGQFYLIQPTIRPLFKTRAAGQSFMTWAGVSLTGDQPYFEYLKASWKKNLFPAQSKFLTPQSFWENVLHDGKLDIETNAEPKAFAFPVFAAVEVVEETTGDKKDLKKDEKKDIKKEEKKPETKKTEKAAPVVGEETKTEGGVLAMAQAALGSLTDGSGDAWEVVFYETVNMGSGQYANNPWMQEMPDPIMRTTWDNFISIPIEWDGDNNFKTPFGNLIDGDIVEVKINDKVYKLPVIRQFGQHKKVISIGLGYGRSIAGLAGSLVGTDLFPEVKEFKYYSTKVGDVKKVGRDSQFAAVQIHHTYGLKNKTKAGNEINVDEQVLGHRGFQGSLTGRSVFFQSTAADLQKGVEALKEKRKEYQYLNSKGLYPTREEVYTMGHWWAMSIDLNACIGCGACTVACMAENNVPVVGKFEVSKFHDMAWLRIDRYFYGDEETPNTAYMPMMCQHCDNAPCENVCPVAATNHSAEGLNQMTYNRCIGTRYCANNCPYKVRRFNWLDYTSADLFPSNEVNMNRGMENDEYYTYMTDNLTRMVLNPDVTVRSRGVIEKCTFCVQRLQEGKLTAKVEGRRLKDGDVKVACQSACPTGAITFGDRNDKESQVAKWMGSHRGYLALEEVNVRSSVTYLMKVVNKDTKFLA